MVQGAAEAAGSAGCWSARYSVAEEDLDRVVGAAEDLAAVRAVAEGLADSAAAAISEAAARAEVGKNGTPIQR